MAEDESKRRYVDSPGYGADLCAAQAVWSVPRILETAGTFVFLTYLTLPPLTSVRAPGRSDTMARSVLDGHAERSFLLRLLGLAAEQPWAGGIKNIQVRRMAVAIAAHHLKFCGMRQEYLDVMAAVIAIAPLRVAEHVGHHYRDDVWAAYWRYMTESLSLMCAQLPVEQEAGQMIVDFVDRNVGLAPDGVAMLRTLADRHPLHVRAAVRTLLPRSRSLVLATLGEASV